MKKIIGIGTVVATLAFYGCAIPGSSLGRYRLEGTLLNKDTGTPISGQKLRITFPGGQGLSAIESTMPEAFGEKTKVQSTETDAKGRFIREFENVYHTSFLIIPPLGILPKSPPEPFYVVQFEDACKKTWGINFSKTPPEARLWDWQKAEFVDLDEKERSEIRAEKKPNPPEYPAPVEDSLQINWSEKNSCAGYTPPDSDWHQVYKTKFSTAKNGIYASWGDVFSNSIGIGYSHRFFQSGFLKIDVPFGFHKSSLGIGLIPKIRLLQIWKIGLQAGLGAEWLRVKAADQNSKAFPGDANGIFALFDVGLEYVLRHGFYVEAGYAGTTTGKNRHDNRAYTRLGWFF